MTRDEVHQMVVKVVPTMEALFPEGLPMYEVGVRIAALLVWVDKLMNQVYLSQTEEERGKIAEFISELAGNDDLKEIVFDLHNKYVDKQRKNVS